MTAESPGARLRRGEVDGIPAFWLATPRRPDRLTATLWFRVGSVDLPLVRHGWIHLLEHVVLHGADLVRRPVNGAVEMLTTVFHVDGSVPDVAEFLTDLCGRLSRPDLSELEHEQRVLRAESRRRENGAFVRHLVWRYGAQGPGLTGFEEFGLETATATELCDLAASAFVRGNATLALDGPPPAGLTLSLPEGDHLPAPRAAPCDQPCPAAFPDPIGGIAMTGVLARSTAATALGRLLGRELQSQIRGDLGMGYSSWAGYELVDAETAVLGAGIDVLLEGRDRLVQAGIDVVDRIVRGEFDETDVRDDARRVAAEMRDDQNASWEPWRAAREAVLHRAVDDTEALIAETESVTGDQIRAVAVPFRDSLLVGVDREPATRTRLPWLGDVPTSRAARSISKTSEGIRFLEVDHPIGESVLTVSDHHAQVALDGKRVVVADAELAAVLHFPDGARALVRRDGYRLVVEPTLWRRGSRATSIIDGWATAALRVPLPERDAASIPRPRTKAWRRTLRRLDPIVPLVLTVVMFAVVFGISSLASLIKPGLGPITFVVLVIASLVGTKLFAKHLEKKTRELKQRLRT